MLEGLLSISLIVAAGSCAPTDPPCLGLAAGDRIKITVLEPYDSNSSYTYQAGYEYDGNPTCGFGFDLASNMTLHATVDHIQQSGAGGYAAGDATLCFSASLQLPTFDNWTWTIDEAPDHESITSFHPVMDTVYNVVNGSCQGWAIMDIDALDNTPFAPEVPGQLPHALLVQDISVGPSSPPCPSQGAVFDDAGTSISCEGIFVVSLTKE
jgi:hypothetical protein